MVIILFLVFFFIYQNSFAHSIMLNVTMKNFDYVENNLKKNTKDHEDLLKQAEYIFETCEKKPIDKFHAEPKNMCRDPPPSVLLTNLVKFQYAIKEVSGILDVSNVQDAFKKYINNFIPLKDKPFIFGSLACEDSKINLTNSIELSICPWHITMHSRDNRYPKMVTHAKCNCEKCLHLNLYPNSIDGQYKCTPVYRLVPALLREKNCDAQTGFYEWKPILEKITVSCVCSRSKTIIG